MLDGYSLPRAALLIEAYRRRQAEEYLTRLNSAFLGNIGAVSKDGQKALNAEIGRLQKVLRAKKDDPREAARNLGKLLGGIGAKRK